MGAGHAGRGERQEHTQKHDPEQSGSYPTNLLILCLRNNPPYSLFAQLDTVVCFSFDFSATMVPLHLRYRRLGVNMSTGVGAARRVPRSGRVILEATEERQLETVVKRGRPTSSGVGHRA